ncbi:SRPBCC family protein [Paenibacillus sambharensis]|uniref:SRPBCC family protein n=1 Tax=Paenibacillus sambharensis TaxID=1803190 RepID=UPI0015E8A8FB|nr:SRPBCC family protein [Paenibacillus sambharensis]
MSTYKFEHNWLIGREVDEIWGFISDFHYDGWWPGVCFNTVRKPEENGVGAEYDSEFKTKLPYKLRFRVKVVSSSPPHSLVMRVTGQLEGQAVWTLIALGDRTHVRCRWEVRTAVKWMSALGPLLKPLFVWNHNRVVAEGVEGLSRRLGTRVYPCSDRCLWNAPAPAASFRHN